MAALAALAALAGAATTATAPRQEAAVVMARQAAEVTDPQGAEEVTAPLHVAMEAPCAAGEHRLRRATKGPKVRMTEGLRLLEHTAPGRMVPAGVLLVRNPALATTSQRPTSQLVVTPRTTPAGMNFRGPSRRLPSQGSMMEPPGRR